MNRPDNSPRPLAGEGQGVRGDGDETNLTIG